MKKLGTILLVLLLVMVFYFLPSWSSYLAEKDYAKTINSLEKLSTEELISKIMDSEKFVLYTSNDDTKVKKTLAKNLKNYKKISESYGYKMYYNEFPDNFYGEQEHYYKDVMKIYDLPTIVIRAEGNFTEFTDSILELEHTVTVFEKTIEDLERESLYK